MNEIKKIECDLCEKECWILYPIILSVDYPFYNRRGVCKDCFKKDDIDENIMKKNLKTINEMVEKTKQNLTFWNDELIRLQNTKETA